MNTTFELALDDNMGEFELDREQALAVLQKLERPADRRGRGFRIWDIDRFARLIVGTMRIHRLGTIEYEDLDQDTYEPVLGGRKGHCVVAAFLKANAECEDTCESVRALAVGEHVLLGGGSVLVRVTRVR